MKVYLDNAATTPIDSRVIDKMLPYLGEHFGNPSSIHSFGRKVKVALEDSREIIAAAINADPSEIYFTSGGTEADNFAIRNIMKTVFEEDGRNEFITSAAEHHAVLDSAHAIEENGFISQIICTGKNGIMESDKLKGALNEKTALVSIMHTNNETGFQSNISELAEITKGRNTIFHSDCVQAFGKTPIDVKKLNIDSLSASSHKIYGPKGIGFLYVKNGTPISPFLFGGSQERNRRGGTENIPGIIGFAEAVKIAMNEMSNNSEKVSALKTSLKKFLISADNIGIEINEFENSSPYILSVTFKSDYYNIDAESMLMYLDINGIAVSNGAACASGTLKPSHVILAMGKSNINASGTIRFSFSPRNTTEEIEYSISILEKFIKHFRKR